MTNEEIFNSVTETIQGFGQRLDVTSLQPASQGVLNKEATRARMMIESACEHHPTLPPIHFDWVVSGELNACAFRKHDRYFIAVNAGALFIAQLLFCRMLADSRFLRHIGNPDEESIQPPIPSWKQNWVPEAEVLHRSGVNMLIPKNAARQHYALYLQNQFMSFLVAHELTHIAHGHVSYAEDQLGLAVVAEGRWAKGEDEPPITSQTLEMDADCGAVSAMVGTIKAKLTEPDKTPPPPWDQYYKEPTVSLFNWSLAVSMFFRLFGDESFAGESLLIRSYPPMRIRQAMALSTKSSYILERWDPELSKPCATATVQAQMEIEKAFPLMTNTPYEVQGVKESWAPAGEEHITLLLNHWKDVLRAELLPHAYGPLPD